MSQHSEGRTLGPAPVVYRFDGRLPPAYHVQQGERWTIRTPDGLGGQISTEHDRYVAVDPDRVNPVVGPIFIDGAEPGDVLAVELHEVGTDASQGYVLVIPGFGLMRHLGWGPRTRIVPFAHGCAEWAPGVRVPLRPCLGTIGVAPAGDGLSTIMPGDHGGNIDSRDVATGTTVYLPINVRGALFGLGDPKAAMGDGEICGTGIGVPARVEITFSTHRGVLLRRPLLETSEEWMTVASAPTLDEAVRLAAEDMIALMAKATGVALPDAYMLLSIAGHLRISQVVDPLMTARMTIAKRFVPPLIPREGHRYDG